MRLKELFWAMFVFLITSWLYYLCLSLFGSKHNVIDIISAVGIGTLFAWLFHQHRKDLFPMTAFFIVSLFVSFLTMRMVLNHVFFTVVVLRLPTTSFVQFGVGIYAGINALSGGLGLFLAWLFYRHSETCP